MTSQSDWNALDAALDKALALDEQARVAYVASLDQALRDVLEPLLEDALRDDSLLDHPGQALSAMDFPVPAHDSTVTGTNVGPYEIESLIGEGGMGRVYRARRADGAFDKIVALKVVRHSLTLAGSDVRRRLRRERELLASLDHPSISRLLDGGETPDGVPYLVTEYIDGTPITQWARKEHASIRERIELMVDVARAVDHAHRRLVVHRDLKPSNILVTQQDGIPRPVVLDFGIAKLLDDVDGEDSVGYPLTRTGMRILTPAYAAPEMFMSNATATTSADVYGLGALLYELLTDHRPHSDTSGSGESGCEATYPSAIVLKDSVNGTRRSRQLRGDLDTICLKALHADPARRYPTASGFAHDLQRYLDGRPVEARPDSMTYVLGRFVRRHRIPVVATILALLFGLVVSVVAYDRERDARRDAEVAQERAEEAADMLAGFMSTADPIPTDGRPVTVREALDEGVKRLSEVDSPQLRAYLLRVVGDTYIKIGDPTRADSLLAQALAIHGKDAVSGEATRVRSLYAATRNALGDYETVLALGEQMYRDHAGEPERAREAWWHISRAHRSLGNRDAALEAARRVVALTPESATPSARAGALTDLGDIMLNAGITEDARSVLGRALAINMDAYGPDSVPTSRTRMILGQALAAEGSFLEAEALLRQNVRFQARVFGPETVGYVLFGIAQIRLSAGDVDGAAAILDSAITMTEPRLPPGHPDMAAWKKLRAEALNATGTGR